MNSKRNPVGWFEIYVSDLPRAKKFYEAVFAVKLENLPAPAEDLEMWMFPGDPERPGATGTIAKMKGAGPGGNPGTIVYFSCEDCAVEESRVARAGGKVIRPKMGIGEYGFISLVHDTEENMIGLHSLK